MTAAGSWRVVRCRQFADALPLTPFVNHTIKFRLSVGQIPLRTFQFFERIIDSVLGPPKGFVFIKIG